MNERRDVMKASAGREYESVDLLLRPFIRLINGVDPMRVRQRLTLGLWIVLAIVSAAVVPIPAQSGAQGALSVQQIVDAVRFREIGPTAQGGRHVEFAVVESNSRVFYAATATGGL